MRTAVPYAQISVQVSPISDVSKRIATIAFAPLRLGFFGHPLDHVVAAVDERLRHPFSSPPMIDFRPAPNWEKAFRERTVRPNTSP